MSAPPVSVVIPTLGRKQLADCLRSIAACRPRPAEVIVVLQGAPAVPGAIVPSLELAGARVLIHPGFGVGSGTNHGLRHATHDVVAVTHDDCTVASDWVATALTLTRAHPGAVLTGRVLPVGDPHRVPSCKTDPTPHDFGGELDPGALYPANMVLPRRRVIAFGAFDERFGPAAEDCDFAYRWLRAGLPLRYEPSLTVHHHDWRSDEQLARLHLEYGFGLGVMYGKHLRSGDRAMLRFLARDVRALARAAWTRRHGPSPQITARLRVSAGLPRGIAHGLRHLSPN